MIVTPGYTFGTQDKITPAKANLLGRPAVTLEDGEITLAKLDPTAQKQINRASQQPGKNLLCNGSFQISPYADQLGLSDVQTGVISGGNKHEIGIGPARWVTPNDANRIVSRQPFFSYVNGPTDTFYLLDYNQTSPLSGINPAYVGQRLELVWTLAGKMVTLAVWVNSQAALTLIPSCRQYFGGTGGSPDVVTPGTPALLPAGVWTQIVQTFQVPSVAGKATGTSFPFIEFRLEVPQGVTFHLFVAQASLVLGDTATGWETRFYHEDYLYASRYFQLPGIRLSTSIAASSPFVNLPVRMWNRNPTLTLLAAAGTGGTVVMDLPSDMIIQNTNHSAVTSAYIVVNGELTAAT